MTDDTSSGAAKRSVDAVAIDIVVRLALVVALIYWSLVLIGPFITILIWGVVLAVSLYPVFVWLRRVLWGRGTLAAIAITVVFLLIIIGPVSLLAAAMVENVQTFSHDLLAGDVIVPPPGDSVKDWPLVGDKIYSFWSLASTNLEQALRNVGPELRTFGTSLLSAVAGTTLGILMFIASVIVAGCLLVPGERLSAGLNTFAKRIAMERGKPFVDLAAATIRNVARGVIGIALLQALLLGMGFLVAGIPGAGLLTIICLFLGIIQIGPAIVVIASIVWAWMDMSTVGALIFTVYMIPAMLLDNFLKPIVMSRGLSTPMVVIFVGVIGGTLAHGIIGLFIGPIVLAVAYEVIVYWVRGDAMAPPAAATPDPARDTSQPVS